MYDISVFIKELKGRFAQWYSQRHDRYGVLWAERFKSVLLEGGEALAAVAGKPKLCRVTLRQAQAKARLQAPPDCDTFNRFGVFGPLGLPRSAGPSGRLGSCRFRLPSNVTRGYSAIFRISGVVCSLKQSGAPRGRLLIRFPHKSSLSYTTCPSSPTKKRIVPAFLTKPSPVVTNSKRCTLDPHASQSPLI